MLLTVSDFIGRFHPVLVHLPIGILVLACFFQWLLLNNRFVLLQPAIPVMLFWGMLSATVSCISGYFLSQSGDYDAILVGRHQWLGISTAAVSLVLYLMHLLSASERVLRISSALLLVAIIITGHLGGTLTHGEGYLTDGLGGTNTGKGPVLKAIPAVQEAAVYNDIVMPLLQARCYSCHGPNKQKGKLRLDQQEYILRGGEDGKVMVPGKADESKMMDRLLLPLGDKDHMPPKEKPQLTESEVALIHWWISTGGDFSKKVKELPATDKIKPILVLLQSGGNAPAGAGQPDIPSGSIVKGDEIVIKKLKEAGVIIIPVGQNSNYLSASFFTSTGSVDSLLTMLDDLKKQLVWLKLDHAVMGDVAAAKLAGLENLTRLQLNNTGITDAGLSKLAALKNLLSLNLVGTKITAKGVSELKALKHLKHIYLYQTGVTEADLPVLKKLIPGAEFDLGNYTVPTFETDTTEVKAP